MVSASFEENLRTAIPFPRTIPPLADGSIPLSGNTTSGESQRPRDRRVRRTQQALLDAFAALVHRQRYDQIQISDILEAADVGRSTFYEHYRGKDDMLLQSMSGIFDLLAAAVAGRGAADRITLLFQHFDEQRVTARAFFLGTDAAAVLPRVQRALAERIIAVWRSSVPMPVLHLPLEHCAALCAEAQLALIRAWIANDRGVGIEELVRGFLKACDGLYRGLQGAEDRSP